MSGNSNLRNAQVAKNDEFYTQYDDIQKEVNMEIISSKCGKSTTTRCRMKTKICCL